MTLSRRSLITGLISLVAAPAIVRASNLMPVKLMVPTVRGFDGACYGTSAHHDYSGPIALLRNAEGFLHHYYGGDREELRGFVKDTDLTVDVVKFYNQNSTFVWGWQDKQPDELIARDISLILDR